MNTYYTKVEFDSMKKTLEKKLKKAEATNEKYKNTIEELKGLVEFWQDEYYDAIDQLEELINPTPEDLDPIDPDYEAERLSGEQYAAGL